MFAQQKADWITKPKDQWPAIAMISEVWYKNGERYIHPSLQYAATGFLLDTGRDTLAVTAKHVLWIAKSKALETIDLKGMLQKWIMHPKNNLPDSVIIGDLLNVDSTEILEGKQSTIVQRDWLIFSTTYRSPSIQPLKSRYTAVKPGEKVYIFACPYQKAACVIYEERLVETIGNKLMITRDTANQVSGASGSAIVDANGFLIGILGGASTVSKTGASAFYGISTRYLQRVLQKEAPLNVPLIPISSVLRSMIEEKGIVRALTHFRRLNRQEQSRFIYSFDSEQFNALGETLLASNKVKEAIEILKLSRSEFKWNPGTYNLLGKAYVQSGQKKLAQKAYRQAIKLNPDDKTAQAALLQLATV